MPVTSQPRVWAAYFAKPPQPQPMSSSAVAGLEFQLVAEHLELDDFGALEVRRAVEEAAGVLVPGPEEERVHPVVDVVVLFRDGARAAFRLQVRQPGLQRLQGAGGADQQPLLGIRAEDAAEHLVEGVAVPVAVHVRLADAERAAQRAAVQAVVTDLDVPGPVAADGNARTREQGFQQRLEEAVAHGEAGGILNRGGRRMSRPGRDRLRDVGMSRRPSWRARLAGHPHAGRAGRPWPAPAGRRCARSPELRADRGGSRPVHAGDAQPERRADSRTATTTRRSAASPRRRRRSTPSRVQRPRSRRPA